MVRKAICLALLGAAAACAHGQGGPTLATQAPSLDAAAGDPFSIAGLRALAPLPGETITAPTYVRELIRVQWRDGDPIDLYVIRPVGVERPPAILFLYGFPSESDRFRNDRFCTLVTRGGYAAVGFASALTGQRYHDRPMKEWFVSRLPEALATSVQDVRMVLNYMTARGDFDMARIGIFGQGSGGTIAILSAAHEPRLKAVDAMDPWGDWPDWLAKSSQIPIDERAAYLTPGFMAAAAQYDPLRWLPALAQPVRVQEALFTATMPAEVRTKIETALPKEAGAVVTYASVDDYTSRVVEGAGMLTWLETHLPAPAAK